MGLEIERTTECLAQSKYNKLKVIHIEAQYCKISEQWGWIKDYKSLQRRENRENCIHWSSEWHESSSFKTGFWKKMEKYLQNVEGEWL